MSVCLPARRPRTSRLERKTKLGIDEASHPGVLQHLQPYFVRHPEVPRDWQLCQLERSRGHTNLCIVSCSRQRCCADHVRERVIAWAESWVVTGFSSLFTHSFFSPPPLHSKPPTKRFSFTPRFSPAIPKILTRTPSPFVEIRSSPSALRPTS